MIVVSSFSVVDVDAAYSCQRHTTRAGCGTLIVGTIQVAAGGAMAVYEYKCKNCGATFEVTCHMDEQKECAVCPKCDSHDVEQVYTGAFSSPPPDKY
jgi:putative FmdB family regulatory protein